MKAFFFRNMYLFGVQTGLQSGHSIDQLWLKYSKQQDSPEWNNLLTFSEYHKTFIILNGGEHLDLENLHDFMGTQSQEAYPFEIFHEPGLNNAATAVAIILPERMYSDVARAVGKAMQMYNNVTNAADKKKITYMTFVPPEMVQAVIDNDYSEWEREFLMRKERCGLAS